MEGNPEGSSRPDKQPDKINRRNVLRAGLGLAGVAGLGAFAKRLGSPHASGESQPKLPQAPTQSPEQPQVPPTKEPELPQAEWNEAIDEGTAKYLYGLYADRMDSTVFTTDDEKMDFLNKLTQVAARLNPEISPAENDLANQLAALISFETNSTFNPATVSDNRYGLFQLSAENLALIGQTPESYQAATPSQQLSLMADFLSEVQKNVSDPSFRFTDLSDLILARIKPTFLGQSSDTILFTKGSDAYEQYKKFDFAEDGEQPDGVLTVGDFGRTVLEHAISAREKEEFLNFGLHDKEPTEFEDADYNTADQTPQADEETAKYLLEKYTHKMTGNSFVGETEDESNQKKLDFLMELTRVAARLNPNNRNMANQIAAVINFETIGSFSAWIQSPGTKATGLIQFMGDTAEEYGTRLYKLRKMSSIAQLRYVEKYLTDKQNELLQKTGQPFWSISDVYMAVFNPAHMGDKDSDIISRKGEATYDQNPGLQNDSGVITVGDATAVVIAAATGEDVKEKPKYLSAPANAPQ